jgi:pilus assembly protein CpaF
MIKCELSLECLYKKVYDELSFTRGKNLEDPARTKEYEKIIKIEGEMKNLCKKGNLTARQFIKQRIYTIIAGIKNISIDTIDSILKQYHVNYYQNLYMPFSSEDVTKLDLEIAEYFKKYVIHEKDSFEKKLAKLSQIIYQTLFGLDVIDELVYESENFNEVGTTRYDFISFQYKGIKKSLEGRLKFKDERTYKIYVMERVTSNAEKEIRPKDPHVEAYLLNGSRVTASIKPLARVPTTAIRIFQDRKNINYKVPKRIERLLKLLIKAKRNILIIGEMGSGKTTMLDYLISLMPLNRAIGLAENIHELDLARKYPHLNIIELQYQLGFEASMLNEAFFRYNRDIVMWGEIRSHLECFEATKACLRNNRGSLMTFHSVDRLRAIHNWRQLLKQTTFYSDLIEAQYDAADALNVIIQLGLDENTGDRFINAISETVCTSMNEFEINDLIQYDKKNKFYRFNKSGLNTKTYNDCKNYGLTEHELNELIELFDIKKPIENESSQYDFILKNEFSKTEIVELMQK